jgi:hypothetical protein
MFYLYRRGFGNWGICCRRSTQAIVRVVCSLRTRLLLLSLEFGMIPMLQRDALLPTLESAEEQS